MNELEKIFNGQGSGKIDLILAITKRLDEIECAFNRIKYNDELMMEIPEVLKVLGAAKDALIAELKTI